MARITKTQAIALMDLYGAYRHEAEALDVDAAITAGRAAAPGQPSTVPAEAILYRLARQTVAQRRRKIFLVHVVVEQEGEVTTRQRVTYAAAARSKRKAQAMVEELLEGDEYRVDSVEARDNPWHYATGAED